MLSKYQEKIKKRYEETESGRIAYAILENRETIGYKGLRTDEEVDLGDGVRAFQDGFLALIVTKHVSDKANRFWYKIVPAFETNIDELIDILESQHWHYL